MFLFVAVMLALAMIGLVSLMSGAAVGAAAVLFKVMMFFILFTFISKMFWFGGRRHHRRFGWDERWRRQPEQEEASGEDQFEEWHRMAHAREEVDSWAPQAEI
jgi:hypothetical protein